MKMTIETVGPEKAKEYLATMPKYQRPPIPLSVKKMTRDMKDGKWLATHQGIAFNKSGELFDGQHRMLAVVASGCSIEIVVFRDVSEDAWHATDIGRKRNLTDITNIHKKEVEVYRVACDMGLRIREPRFEDLSMISESKIGEKTRDLIEFSPAAKRFSTQAAVKLMAVIWSIKSKSDYPFEQYRALSLSHYHLMSMASQSLCRQLEQASKNTRAITWFDMALRTYICFNPENEKLTRILYRDPAAWSEKINRDIRQILGIKKP